MIPTSWSVAVLVSAGRHPGTGAARACRGDAIAMALGRRIAGDALRVLHAGSPEEPALQDYLALGAGTVEAVSVPAGHGVLPALVSKLQNVDLILTGSRTELGAGSGLLPYTLANALGRSVIANVLDARLERDGVRLQQFLPKGKRRGIVVPLPLVLAVHPLAPVELTYAYARRQSGRIVAAALDTPPALASDGGTANTWTVETAARRPVRLEAREKKAGHARMMSAIVTESKSGVVAIEGSCVDKAQMLLTYLRENRLVDF